MTPPRAPDTHKESPTRAPGSRSPEPANDNEQEKTDDEPEVDPLGQSPDAPIEFEASNEVARGNAERANAEPEPAALHDAEVPGKPDVAQRRRDVAKHHDE
jgi:hypothetical protein